MLIVGVLCIIDIVLASFLGFEPSGGEAVLKWLAGQTTLAYAFYGLFILIDFLLVPVVLTFYLVLKGFNKNAMLAATGFAGLYLVLDLGVTLSSWVALVTLSQSYAAATSDIQRAAYVATADYALAVIALSATVYSSVISSIWIFITSLVMLKGIFSRATAYLGIVVSIVGFIYGISVFVPPLAIFLAIVILLLGIWLLLAGYRLYRLGKR